MTKNQTTTWDIIKQLYETKFNIPGKVIDYIAVNRILKACVDGYKNSTIVDIVKDDRGYINDVIVQFFHFYGWDETLDIPPFLWYTKCHGEWNCFEHRCNTESCMMTDIMIKEAYRICELYSKFLKEINDYYANNNSA